MASNKEKMLSYKLPSEQSLIYEQTSSYPTLRVFDKDSILVKKNVYLFNFTIWNSGEIDIDKSDIRRDLKLILNDCDKILDVKVIKEEYRDITKVKVIEPVQNSYDKKSIIINWEHLDAGLGFTIQVIYSSDLKSEIYFEGIISGINSFKDSRSIKEKNETLYWSLFIFCFTIVQIILFKSATLIHIFVSNFNLPVKNLKIAVSIIIFFLILFVIGFYTLFIYYV